MGTVWAAGAKRRCVGMEFGEMVVGRERELGGVEGHMSKDERSRACWGKLRIWVQSSGYVALCSSSLRRPLSGDRRPMNAPHCFCT